MENSRRALTVPDNALMTALLGEHDELLRAIEGEFADTHIHVRGNQVTSEGPASNEVVTVFAEMMKLASAGRPVDRTGVRRLCDMVQAGEAPSEVMGTEILRSRRGRSIRPKSAAQKRYVEAIASHVITFALGPAGTGKSWLAVAMGVLALQNNEVERIVLTRPAVEAGEHLGFLPGDLMAKVDPYLRPLNDALHDMLDFDQAERLVERGAIEVAPLAFMRGRTLNDSFIILDEAQNTTPAQMKMFLTRIGFGSKVVVTGDRSQTDVGGQHSGLSGLEPMLGDIDGIAFVHLGRRDVVRHSIVQSIVEAYETEGPSGPGPDSGGQGSHAGGESAPSTT